MKLSIIVPVYNVAEYIEKCILSLQDQDIVKEDYEIIVVNDGSPDSSAEVVRRLQGIYNNIILLEQENQGVSMARNNAIAIARGNYLMPIDPDDYIVPNSLMMVLDKAINQDLDVLYLGFDILDNKNNLIWKSPFKDLENKIFPGIEGYFAARGKQVMDPDRSVAILYRRALLEDFSISYTKDVPYLEDGLFLAKVFCHCRRCAFDSSPFYQRTTRPGSATHSKLVHSEKALAGFLKAAEDLRTFRRLHGLKNEQNKLVNHVIAKFILLPVTSCAGSRDLRAFRKVKDKIRTLGFNKLDLAGCREIYYKYGVHYNRSINWFFLYYSSQLILKSFSYRFSPFGKPARIAK
jgi:glycosyltransferase involved in cell wall biosynthesis